MGDHIWTIRNADGELRGVGMMKHEAIWCADIDDNVRHAFDIGCGSPHNGYTLTREPLSAASGEPVAFAVVNNSIINEVALTKEELTPLHDYGDSICPLVFGDATPSVAIMEALSQYANSINWMTHTDQGDDNMRRVWIGSGDGRDIARRALTAAHSQQTPSTAGVSEAQVVAVARVICREHAEICGVNESDAWNTYETDFKEQARTYLTAASEAQPNSHQSVPSDYPATIKPDPSGDRAAGRGEEGNGDGL